MQQLRAVFLASALTLSLAINAFLLKRLIDRFDGFDDRLRTVEIAVGSLTAATNHDNRQGYTQK